MRLLLLRRLYIGILRIVSIVSRILIAGSPSECIVEMARSMCALRLCSTLVFILNWTAMSFTWIRKPWKFVDFRKSTKIPQGGTGSTSIEKPQPLFIDDGETFRLSKKFTLMILHLRFSQVFSKILDQNKAAIDKAEISDKALGMLIGHVIGEAALEKFGRSDEPMEGKELQSYVEFLRAIVTGYSDANLSRTETLLRKD